MRRGVLLLVVVTGLVVAGLGIYLWQQESSTSVPPERVRPVFTDIAASAGLDFRHENGARGRFWLPEIMSGGGAFVDYDGDGLLDVFLVQSGIFGEDDPDVCSRLYRNLGGGRFQDVTVETRTGITGYGMGCAAADFDGDGDIDLYITRVGSDVLLRNDGGTFSDVTKSAGLGDPELNSSAAWIDHDGDGDLDLYVARYLRWSPELVNVCRSVFTQTQDYCDPSSYDSLPDVFYQNNGDGTFRDASIATGIAGKSGYGLAVACSDYDNDGDTDIYVANDQTPGFLWVNQGDGSFVENAVRSGCALNGESKAIAGMGIAAEDFDEDGDVDLFVTNIRTSANLFLRREGRLYHDVSARWGERRWLTRYTGFGVVAFDQDLDGALEMFIADGAVNTEVEPYESARPYAEPNSFLRKDETGRFIDANSELGQALDVPDVSRGVAYGDIDNDGDLDLLVCRNGDRPLLLRNDQPFEGHWLVVEALDERGESPVLNTRITVEAGKRRWIRESRPQQSYMTTSDPRAHFGLGAASTVDRIVIRWPDGRTEEHGPTGVDGFLTVRRGAVEAAELQKRADE